MTHDELLAKINIGAKFDGPTWSIDGNFLIKQSLSLRAVVELHKPEQEIGGGCDENGQELWVCIHCIDGDGFQDYPCPTIQAIQKELL
jgi:hypothetical protein